MSLYLTGNYYFLTDKGRVRKVNEDSAQCALNPFGNVFLVIADGMGGATKGDVASSKLVDYLIKSFRALEEEFKNPKAVKKKVDDTETQVDAVTGATLTSDGVSAMLHDCLGKYIKFLQSKE